MEKPPAKTITLKSRREHVMGRNSMTIGLKMPLVFLHPLGVTWRFTLEKNLVSLINWKKTSVWGLRIIHTGEKPQECKICGKVFDDCFSHRKHGRTCVGEKLWMLSLTVHKVKIGVRLCKSYKYRIAFVTVSSSK